MLCRNPAARIWLPNQAERRLRPLARRALRMARPLRVAMRARKPCRRARFKRLGWKVRFISKTSYLFEKKTAKTI